MKYQYKIISLGYKGELDTVYKKETDMPLPFSVGDEIWFPENWKKGQRFKIKKIQHYVVDDFIAVYVEQI